MNLTAHRLTSDLRLAPCAPEEALREARADDGVQWLHIQGASHDELCSLLAGLDLSPFVMRRLEMAGQSTKVAADASAVVLETRLLPHSQTQDARQVVVVCLPHFVITVNPSAQDPAHTLAHVAETLEVSRASSSALLHALLLALANRLAPATRGVRTRLFELDRAMDVDAGAVDAGMVLELRDELLRLAAVAEEQTECFEELAELPPELLDSTGLEHTQRLMQSVAAATERLTDRLEKRVNDLRRRHDSHLAEKTNRRLALLTIVSAVFMPMSLMAGIWGMNFATMPELHQPWAYPAALGSMVLVGLLTLLGFRRAGWFD